VSTEQPAPLKPTGNKASKQKPSAGICLSCGFYKSWGYRIPNLKTGKLMPAHINLRNGPDNTVPPAETLADVLGDGDCPLYAQKPAAAPAAPVTNQTLPIETKIITPKPDSTPIVPRGTVTERAETMFAVDKYAVKLDVIINTIGEGLRIMNENLHAICDYTRDIGIALKAHPVLPESAAPLTKSSQVTIG
jgi:hypothetical protein